MLDLGGKALTNYLKELVSYRAINVMDETLIMDDFKEKLCFLSLDVPRDLQIARKPGKDNLFKCSYVLLDDVTHTKGFVKDVNKAQRYLTLYDEAISYGAGGKEGVEEADLTEKIDHRRINLTKNGGFGKSTFDVNLAYTLVGMGSRVAIFNADVYGPSLPTMVSLENRLLEMNPEKRTIIPTKYLGVKLVSFGFAGHVLSIMRGPMVSGLSTNYLLCLNGIFITGVAGIREHAFPPHLVKGLVNADIDLED